MSDSPLPPPSTGLDDVNAQHQADLLNRYEALKLMLLGAEEALNQLDYVAQSASSPALLPIAHKLREAHHQIAEHAAAWHAFDSAVLQQYRNSPLTSQSPE
jgi:hypothetical protein